MIFEVYAISGTVFFSLRVTESSGVWAARPITQVRLCTGCLPVRVSLFAFRLPFSRYAKPLLF